MYRHKSPNSPYSLATKNSFLSSRLRPIALVILFLSQVNLCAQQKPVPTASVEHGKLHYTSDAYGNRIPDFSYCGYKSGTETIPDVPVKVVVPPKAGDATSRIQAAIDYVSSLPVDPSGFRGAVLLQSGRYEVEGSLIIKTSGVVLRGSGMGRNGTVLVGTTQSRETLIQIFGKDDQVLQVPVSLSQKYIPVNAKKVAVSSPQSFRAGDFVVIHRPSTQVWIDTLEMNEFGGEETQWLGWKAGQRDIFWHRQIQSVESNTIVLDAPITTAIDDKFGGCTVSVCTWPGRIVHVGVENISCESAYDRRNPKDEDHRWMAITMENVRDAWVRQVAFKHFAGSAVALFETVSRVTVEDCISTEPVSEIGGQRRNTFFTSGEQTLFQRVSAEEGYHDFAVGFCAAGPNAFVQCESKRAYNFSGTIDSWASGVLLDNVNVEGQTLGFMNRRQDAHGAGWTAANSLLWQCSASRIDCFSPPTATNWSFGSWGQFSGNGQWHESNNHVNPRSLYYFQLAERIGPSALERAQLLPRETNATSSPTVDEAKALSTMSVSPAMTLREWINLASTRHTIPTNASNATTVDKILINEREDSAMESDHIIVGNGLITTTRGVLTGGRWGVSWWRGDVRPYERPRAKPHITRFVPGRTGNGLTDDLDLVTDHMQQQHILAIEHNYGLWYDRRRDDHERVRRMDGDVWPPFYELPFKRSGKETAWDGLSKYDLTQFNPWYWQRLKEFSDLADKKGLILIHKHYFQHNVLEAGAHWTDFPWRSDNNINETGFPEPPPYAGDKRIFMAEQFYDVSTPGRRQLHRAYIRQCLENFSANTNVIHLIGEEYTGPLHFVQFWLDVIGEWEKETGKDARVALSTTKDVQDEILSDSLRSKWVDIIDIRYWHYQGNGEVYGPIGGQNLAPRQHARILKPGKTSFFQVYRAVLEYREKFPNKAVVYSGDNADHFGWAAFMAGGSLSAIPQVDHSRFVEDAATMKPLKAGKQMEDQWVLGNDEHGYIIYVSSRSFQTSQLLPSSRTFTARWIDPENGRILKEQKKVAVSRISELTPDTPGAKVIWLSTKQN